ncbi:MAG: S8 family serine peptidase, partial [Actinomycetota bacterium]|nr:S8 family serine peptidase [Actinomycetota bacterium]
MNRAADAAVSRVAVACALVLGLAFAGAGSAEARRASFVPGELIVRFAPDATAAEQADTLRDRGAEVERALPFQRLKLVRLSRGASVHDTAAALERDPDVAYAEPNYVRKLARRIPNDPSFVDLWGLDNTGDADIDAPEAWDFTTGSESIVVAVVDTGIAHTHSDLTGNIWTSPREVANGRDDDANGFVDDVRGWDFVAKDNAPLDDNGHGTHVAGIIGARGDNATGVVGVTWHVKLMPLRAANSAGTLSDADIAAAFRYAGRMGARIVNGSFGSPGFSRTLLEAIEAHPNTLFVFAAGNGGSDGRGDNNDSSPEFPCSYALPNIVCVAASTSSG